MNPQKVALLRGASDVVTGAAQVADAVRRGLAEPSRLTRERRAVTDDLFYCPGGATVRATECIYDLLSLPAPERLPAAVPPELTPAFTSFEERTI